MTPQSFFAAYVEDRRQAHIARLARESLGHLVRYVARDLGAEGLVAYASLTTGREVEQIREQVEYFRSIRQDFEWKVYELDQPRSMEALLAAESFVPGEREAFMVYEVRVPTPDIPSSNGEWTVERVISEAGIRDVLSVQEVVWGRGFEWLYTQLCQRFIQRPDELCSFASIARTPEGSP